MSWIVVAALLAKSFAKQGKRFAIIPGLLNRLDISQAVIIGGFGLLISINLIDYSRFSARHYGWTLENSTDIQNYELDNEEILNAINHIARSDAIIYTNETALYYGLANGLLNNESIFYPAISDTEREKQWIQDNSNLKYLLAMNPIIRFPSYSQNGIVIDSNSALSIRFGIREKGNEARFLVEGSGTETKIRVKTISEYGYETTEMIEIVDSPQWVTLSSAYESINDVTITLNEGSQQIKISGFRVSASETQWPWGEDVIISYIEALNGALDSNIFSVEFKEVFSAWDINMTVTHDRSSLILAKIE